MSRCTTPAENDAHAASTRAASPTARIGRPSTPTTWLTVKVAS
jgi:hypothetical protein